ncbi:TPA: hypothetical protein ACKP36_004396 [Serratia marcescens]|uniref:hypothetical protein n=1 Tax=Serratia marcescens TaxID=615 RepID=UPI00301E2227
MKLNMTKIAAAMVLLGSVGAHAAVDPATMTTQSQPLVFTAPSDSVSLEINPVSDLKAGAYTTKTKVASIVVTPKKATDTVALRFSQAIGVEGTYPNTRVYNGLNADNKLEVMFTVNNLNDLKTEGWYDSKAAGVVNEDMEIYGDQTIAADTYTVSMDAAIWTA